MPSSRRGESCVVLPLIAATYFMVSGGPYGIEDVLGGAGFALGNRHSAGAPHHLEPAHCADDWRTGQRDSCRGRILHLGAAGSGAVLGISGELALALRQRLRHGHLSGHLRSIPGTLQPRADGRLARLHLVVGGRGRLLFVELAGCACCGRRSRRPVRADALAVRRLRGAWTVARHLLNIPPCSGITPAPVPLCRPQFWWGCGITWAGTMPRPLRRKSRLLSEPILAP